MNNIIKEEKKQAIIVIGIISLLIAIVYNIIFFAIPLPKISMEAFYITYGCTMVAILLSVVIFALSIYTNKIKNNILRVTLVRCGYIMVASQLLLDCVIMIFGSIMQIKPWIAIVSEVVLFVITISIVLIRRYYIKKIKANVINEINNESFIIEMKKFIREIILENKDEKIINDLNNLEELINYTVPSSNMEVVELEDQILENINELRNNAQANKKELIENISLLIKERKVRLEK